MRKEKNVKEIKLSDSNSFAIKENNIPKNRKKKPERPTDDMKLDIKYREIKKIQDKDKLKPIPNEKDQGIALHSPNSNSNESLIVPLNIKEKIERIILKILYDEKSVKSLKELTEKTLESAAKERITISEKPITMIIHQMNKEEKIQFTQKDGWKIRI